MPKILIVAEVKNGEIKKNTLELLSFAKSQGLETDAVLSGSGVAGQADVLAGQGASTVYLADDASLEIYNTEQYTALVTDALQHQRQLRFGCLLLNSDVIFVHGWPQDTA